RLLEEGRVLRLLGELAVERGLAGKLDRERVAGEALRVRLAQHRRGRDRLLLDGGQDRALPGLLELLEVERRAGDGLRGGSVGDSPCTCPCVCPCVCPCDWHRGLAGITAALQLLQAVGDRLAREVGRRPRHLDKRELE